MQSLREESRLRIAEPCIIVIFGATGDLTARKLVPALYNLMRDGQLPSFFACVGFARRSKSDDQFRDDMKRAVFQYSRTQPIDLSLWEHFKNHLFYHVSEFHDEEGYRSLSTLLRKLDFEFGTKGNRIFYYATPASYFGLITEKLDEAGLIVKGDEKKEAWSRVIIEKPFGDDLDSALALQQKLLFHLSENQLFRIDHYLGKETVQNLLVFRFANSIFESLWNNRYIDQVQITVAEDLGIGTRGKFFEEAGLLRDIVQNHMMQLLSLIAMEPPVNLDADSIRDEKVKVLHAIRPFKLEEVVRGQYGSGLINGEEVVAYREEKNVNPNSCVETYVALKVHVDSWRWAGTPFYLRAGKRLAKRGTEIAVIFKEPPRVLFQGTGAKYDPNYLVIRIQPDEGCALKINCKVPGPFSPIEPVKMDFRYGSYFGIPPPEAYERLICDCILDDSTLFARDDEVFQSWRLLTPILRQWASIPVDFPNYRAGSWGPKVADHLMTNDERFWRRL